MNTSTFVSLEENALCRLCCSNCPTESPHAYGHIPPLKTFVHTLFNFWIESTDVSHMVCNNCLMKVIGFYEFYKQVEISQKKLASIAKDSINSTESDDKVISSDTFISQVNIKNEDDEDQHFILNNDKDDADTPHEYDPTESVKSSDEDDFPSNLSQTFDKDNTSEFPSEIYKDGKLLFRGSELNRILCKFYDMKCNICPDKRFDTFPKLNLHYKTVHKTTGYIMCCETKVSSKRSAIYHLIKHLQPSALKCHICNRACFSPWALQGHLDTHLPESEKPHKCNACNKGFTLVSHLNKHKKQAHAVEHNDEKTYYCEICGKMYPSIIVYKRHQKLVHCEQKHLCSECGRRFRNRGALNQHLDTHKSPDDRRIKCTECDAMYINESTMKKHMRIHSGHPVVASIKCSMCNYSTTIQSILNRHMLIKHSIAKPHSCVICEKKFKFKKYLDVHMVQHTGERISCPFCPKVFASSGNFSTHRKRVHAKEIANLKKERLEKIAKKTG